MNEREIKELENTIAVNKDYKKHYHLCDFFEVELIDKLLKQFKQIQQENQQLKESYCNRTDCSGRLHDSKKYPSVKQQLDLYKSVLDEIREYINGFDFERLHEVCEHNLVEVLEMILQILDKVKE